MADTGACTPMTRAVPTPAICWSNSRRLSNLPRIEERLVTMSFDSSGSLSIDRLLNMDTPGTRHERTSTRICRRAHARGLRCQDICANVALAVTTYAGIRYTP